MAEYAPGSIGAFLQGTHLIMGGPDNPQPNMAIVGPAASIALFLPIIVMFWMSIRYPEVNRALKGLVDDLGSPKRKAGGGKKELSLHAWGWIMAAVAAALLWFLDATGFLRTIGYYG